MLVEMLKKNTAFTQLTPEKQSVYARLAEAFENDKETSLFLSPSQLTLTLQIGNNDLWFEFLNLEPVRAFIKAQVGFQMEVAARQNFGKMAQHAQAGNLDVQGIKLLNDMAGVMQSGSNNKVVVLHRVSRPKVERRKLPDGTVEQVAQATVHET